MTTNREVRAPLAAAGNPAAGERSRIVARQVFATEERPRWTLPQSWYEPGCAERMADWLRRFAPTG